MKIASILDNFTYTCFKYEGDFLQLDSSTWEETLQNEKPDMLFVESAWNENFKKLFRRNPGRDTPCGDPVCWCKQHHIPTVFWNKEDPFHFDYFIEIAKDFDFIFTTDLDCIPRYQAITGHNRVYLLPFAAQIKIHNPVNKDLEKIGDVAFAGTWYNLRHDRQNEMELLLNPALKYGLHIYDRMYNFTLNRNYVFPEKYQPNIKGYLPYEDMVNYYKKYNIFLNVNTVKTSPTMLSRRVMELLACGTNIISSQSAAIEKLFPGIVMISKCEEDTEKYLNLLLKDKNLRDRLSLLGQREVFNKHTYRHRFNTILSKVGFRKEKNKLPGVSVIAVTNKPDALYTIIDHFKNQSYLNSELIVIVNNNHINLEQWSGVKSTNQRISIFQIDEKETLGECYNLAIRLAKCEFISFFDDEDFYAPNFIGDLINAFDYTDAGIVGKYSHYAYIQGLGVLGIRNPDMENRYVDTFPTSAVVIRKDVMDLVKFNPAAGNPFPSLFCDCIQKGIRLYSSDRFNYIRQSDTEDPACKTGEFLIQCSDLTCASRCQTYVTI